MAAYDEPDRLKRLYKYILVIVSISQLFGGAGLAAGITVGALLAQQMLGTEAWAGLPSALFTLGSALAAYLVGSLTQRYGRRNGLVTGYWAGAIGACGIAIAAATNSLILLFISMFIYGAGTATNLQARYAGTDLATANRRATAISVAMVSTTFGAIAGPNLTGVMGDFARSIGMPELAGPFVLSGTAFFLSGLVIFLFLRPDPYLFVKSMEHQNLRDDAPTSSRTETAQNPKGVAVGSTVMIVTQLVMVAIMTMTPIHMEHHGHGLNEIGVVISVHIGSMYLPSLVTGMLVDKIGRSAMVAASGVTLLLAGITAAAAPTDSMMMLVIALALLGLGWNFGLISGTALIVDSAPAATRAKIQGAVDVSIAVAGASGGAMSGWIVAGFSYATLSFAGGLLSLVLIPVLLWAIKAR